MAQGFRGKTLPFRVLGRLFGSLFESNVPMESMTLRQTRDVALWLALLSPLIIAAIIPASPLEWLRARRVTRHNAAMKALLLNGGAASGSRDADSDLEERAVINYRIESEGRAIFLGTALVSVSGERRALLGFTVHRDTPPPSALDGEALKSALVERGAVIHEVCHWQWELRDPYELIERSARPW
jgi:hypothetical protein